MQHPVHQPQTLLHATCQFEIVSDDDEAGAQLLVELLHQIKQVFRTVAIQIAGWLVRQHTGRIRHQRARNRSALALAAGQLGGQMPDAMRESHFGKHRGGNRFCVIAFHAAYQQRHRDIFKGGEFRQQVVKLIDET